VFAKKPEGTLRALRCFGKKELAERGQFFRLGAKSLPYLLLPLEADGGYTELRHSGGEFMPDQIHCVDLGKLAVPGMRIKVRWFPAGANNGQVWRAPSNILSFSRVVGEGVQHRDVSKHPSSFRAAGPLTFWPRSAVWESRKNRSQVLTVSAYFDTSFTPTTVSGNPQGILIDDFSMLEMMQILHDEVRTPGMASHEMVGAIGDILRIKLSRLMSQRARNPLVRKPCRSVDVAMVHDLISHSGGRLPTTTELAEKFNVGRRDLLRLFKATTGMPPSRYIEETKLDRAKTLLATSKLTMKQIAYDAGYSTASHFSTKFRQFTGLTPSAFRNRARRQDDLRSEHDENDHDENQTGELQP
jgi:AraC-like DNA-binding protein